MNKDMKQSDPLLPYQGIMPKIASDAWIASSAVVIGDVQIGAESSIWHHVTIRGDINSIRIGARTNIQDGSVVHVQRASLNADGGGHVTIGDDITIGHMALIHACELQDKSFVGMKAMVMDGAVIESHGMLAAGAVLTPDKIIRSRELWMGTPAKFVRHLTDDDLHRMAENTAEYVQLSKTYK